MDEEEKALLSELRATLKDDHEWKADVTESLADLRDRMTRIESEIRGSGGIVGRAVCEAREKALVERMCAQEKAHAGLVAKVWAVALAALTGLIGAIYAAVTKP